MNINKKNLTIQILAIVGLALSVKLAFIYYVANYEQYALSSFCSINDFVDCDGAARTLVSQFLGIPLAYWGMFFYCVVLFLTIVNKLKQIKFLKFLEVFKNPMAYITTLGMISFIVSMYLAGVSIFQIKKLCILCVVTYFIDLLIALTAASFNIKQLFVSFKTMVLDFIAGVKQFPKTFVVLLVLATAFLTYSGTTYNFIPHVKKHMSIMKYRKMEKNPYAINGNELGDKDATVVVELYSDFVCPVCYIHNIMLHQAVKELSNVKVVHHNFPFDKECNPYISVNMHPRACFMAKGVIAARNQGNYWGMSSKLYELQPKKTEDLVKIAEELGFDKNMFIEDMNSSEAAQEIADELKNANRLGLNATPTMIINGEIHVGAKPYYILKELLIKHGAKKR